MKQVFSGVGAVMDWDFDKQIISLHRQDSTINRLTQFSDITIRMEQIQRVEIQLITAVRQMGYIRFVLRGSSPHGVLGLDATTVLFTDGARLYPLINQLCALYPAIRIDTKTAGVDPRSVSSSPYRTVSQGQTVYTPPPVPPSAANTPPRPPASAPRGAAPAVSAKKKATPKWQSVQNLGEFLVGCGLFALGIALPASGIAARVIFGAVSALSLFYGVRDQRLAKRYQQLEYARGGERSVPFSVLAKRLKWSENRVRRELISLTSGGYFPDSRFDLNKGVWELPEGYLPTVPVYKSDRIQTSATLFLVFGLLCMSPGLIALPVALSNGFLTAGFWKAASFAFTPLVTGLGMCIHSSGLFRLQRRCKMYYSVMGDQKVISLPMLAEAGRCSVARVEKDLRKAFFRGYFPGSVYIPENRYLLLPGGELPQSEEQKPAADDVLSRVEEQIRQIREVNDRIPDPTISAKIDRMEQITVQILVILEDQPEKRHEARRFLNYYLPTTLKLLNVYADFDAQEIKTDSVTHSMRHIEKMLDTLLSAYEKQLDQLFTAQTLDISAEIRVMETMLKRDGLSEGETSLLRPAEGEMEI